MTDCFSHRLQRAAQPPAVLPQPLLALALQMQPHCRPPPPGCSRWRSRQHKCRCCQMPLQPGPSHCLAALRLSAAAACPARLLDPCRHVCQNSTSFLILLMRQTHGPSMIRSVLGVASADVVHFAVNMRIIFAAQALTQVGWRSLHTCRSCHQFWLATASAGGPRVHRPPRARALQRPERSSPPLQTTPGSDGSRRRLQQRDAHRRLAWHLTCAFCS